MANRSDDFESPQIYRIPENFAEGTGIFGGIFPLRNFVEGVLFAIPMLLLALAIPTSSLNVKVPVIILMVSPALLIGCVGINGDSVLEFLGYFTRYRKRKRIARYNPRVKLEFTGDLSVSQREIPIDRIKRMLVNLSRKDRQEQTETDRYYSVGQNIAFEDDLELEKRLSAKAGGSVNGYGKHTKKIPW